MDIARLAKMLSDHDRDDLRKMQYKYSVSEVAEMIGFLRSSLYKKLPLLDFSGEPLMLMGSGAQIDSSVYRLLLKEPLSASVSEVKSMEDEIHSTLAIESIDSSRDSIKKILLGKAPENDEDIRLLGMKRGLEFISDPANKITKENIHSLYDMAIADFLDEENRLAKGKYYRDDAVFVVGGKIEHSGLPYTEIPAAMAALTAFASARDGINDLVKAAVIHFYLAYIHPYFDGNGRMARLLHSWYLVQRGFSAARFVPLSASVNRHRREYYKAFGIVEKNSAISSLIDVTPFVNYFAKFVYNELSMPGERDDGLTPFKKALDGGGITEKEKALFEFVLTAYGGREFSSKQLEKDFGAAAYATVRSFLMKFERMGLLRARKYVNRTKYRLPE